MAEEMEHELSGEARDLLRDALSTQPVTDEEAMRIETSIRDEGAPSGFDRLIAKSMLRGLQRALEQEDHPFPGFAARLIAVRKSNPDESSVTDRFEITLDTWMRFERGELHPAWFSKAGTASAARILPSDSEWQAAIREAVDAQPPREAAPTDDELARIPDPWAESLEELNGQAHDAEIEQAAAEIQATEFPEPVFETGRRVRSRAHDQVGVVLREVSTGMYEVSLPDGQVMISEQDLELVEASPAEMALSGQIGRLPAFASRLQALYLLHAYRYDDLSGLSNARVEPKPHQIFVAWRVLHKVRPRMILADEVGLGKTIEAGIILKELEARQVASRVLIVVPASLVGQWVWEMKSKFNIDLEVYDGPRTRDLRRRSPDKNIWALHDQVICSLPFASRDNVAKEIADAEWDVVIFDEAHRVRKSGARTTKAYRLADDLRFSTYGMLMLTATPMQLDSSELFSMIELIEPGLFAGGYWDFESQRKNVRSLNEIMQLLDRFDQFAEPARIKRIEEQATLLRNLLSLSGSAAPEEIDERLGAEEIRAELEEEITKLHPLAEVMVRNRKKDIPEAFARRTAQSTPVPLSQDEADVYEQVEQYVREGFNRAKASKNMATGFLMVSFQKMLTSSSHALARSFERRARRLRQGLSEAPQEEAVPRPVTARVGGGEEPPTGLRGFAKWDSPNVVELREAAEQSDAIDEVLRSIEHEGATRFEIEELEGLVTKLDALPDSKFAGLQGLLEEIFKKDEDEKVIIFTQFIETQLFIQEHLAGQYAVQIFNGRQSAEQKDRAVRYFRDRDQILISTEAGGEGRNFQFAHIVVNYDLPWNPMRIEQRIGRVDRIGQKRDVIVRNLFMEHPDPDKRTLDERVFEVLQERINVFEESIGSLDPILGDIEDEIRRVALEVDPADVEAEFLSLNENIEAMITQARQAQKRLRDFVMERNSFRSDKVQELLAPGRALATWSDLKQFADRFLDYHGGSVDEHTQGGDVITLPLRLSHQLRERRPRTIGTFDPEKALAQEEIDFFAIGHPLVDRILEFAAGVRSDASVAATEETGQSEQWLLDVYYRVAAKGVKPAESFIRHRCTPSEVLVDEITSLPVLGDEARATPGLSRPDIELALRRSEDAIASKRQELQVEMEDRNELLRAEELQRADRIFQYRRNKELQTIHDQEVRLAEYEREGTQDQRRLIPAIRGRIEAAQRRLELVELDHKEELASIEQRSRTSISYELLGVTFVHQRPE